MKLTTIFNRQNGMTCSGGHLWPWPKILVVQSCPVYKWIQMITDGNSSLPGWKNLFVGRPICIHLFVGNLSISHCVLSGKAFDDWTECSTVRGLCMSFPRYTDVQKSFESNVSTAHDGGDVWWTYNCHMKTKQIRYISPHPHHDDFPIKTSMCSGLPSQWCLIETYWNHFSSTPQASFLVDWTWSQKGVPFMDPNGPLNSNVWMKSSGCHSISR